MGLGGCFRTLLSFFFLFFFSPSLQRFASLSRFVETLVVADDKMAAFHGTGLKRYLLTVMAAAAKAFKHPSIRNPVSLVVTRLVILGSGQEGPQVGPSAAQTLRSFCAWQRGLNTPDDSDPDHFDTAILFTRQVRLPGSTTPQRTTTRRDTAHTQT